jgi:hypothetical protein
MVSPALALSLVLSEPALTASSSFPRCSYDATAAIGLVRAAEKSKSPAILQLFPVTMRTSSSLHALCPSIHAG